MDFEFEDEWGGESEANSKGSSKVRSESGKRSRAMRTRFM